jgi:hypothetical protein
MNTVEKFNQKYGNVYESFCDYANFKRNYMDVHDVAYGDPWLESGCTLVTPTDNNHLDEIVVIEEDCMKILKIAICCKNAGFF